MTVLQAVARGKSGRNLRDAHGPPERSAEDQARIEHRRLMVRGAKHMLSENASYHNYHEADEHDALLAAGLHQHGGKSAAQVALDEIANLSVDELALVTKQAAATRLQARHRGKSGRINLAASGPPPRSEEDVMRIEARKARNAQPAVAVAMAAAMAPSEEELLAEEEAMEAAAEMMAAEKEAVVEEEPPAEEEMVIAEEEAAV